MAVLTEEQRRRFEDDGYLILSDPCPPEWIDPVLADMEPLYRQEPAGGELEIDAEGVVFNRHPKRGGERYWHRIRNAWKVSDSVRRLALAPRVLMAIEELYGGPALASQTLNFALGTQQPAHSDSFEFQPDPPGLMCGAWVALEDIDVDSGPLFYHPGSHRLPLPSWDQIAKVIGRTIDPADFSDPAELYRVRRRAQREYFGKLAQEYAAEPRLATVKKGQALIWAANLLHGGSPQNDESRTRHSQVTHYFMKGARVYPTILRVGDRIPWDYPEWVRDPVPRYSPRLLAETVAAHVPAGAKVAVAGGTDGLSLEDREAIAFPDPPDWLDGPAATALLERLRSEGARHVVFGKDRLRWLGHEQTDLQDVLEDRHRALLRDGAVAAIYELSD